VRFAGARTEGLSEEIVARIDAGYEACELLEPRERAALALTDAIVGAPRALGPAEKAALRTHFSDAQIAEIALGVGLFHALSKVLIALGLEPESMPVTVIPTPA
jgi:alkylhydroperoxidase family enzyme